MIPKDGRQFFNLNRCTLMKLQIFFFQAEDGIRDSSTSRGLGDVYKRQDLYSLIARKSGLEKTQLSDVLVTDNLF